MLNIYTHKPNILTLNRMAMRLGFFVVLFFGILNLGVSQSIGTCGLGSQSGADVLSNAVDISGISMPSGHANNGAWTMPVGVTFNDNGSPLNATDDVINTPPSAGSPYTLTWTHSGGTVYTVQLVVTGKPAVNSFTADVANHCGIPYKPTVLVNITGGTTDYSINLLDGGAAVAGSPFSSIPSGNTTLPINHAAGFRSVDASVDLVSVTDANGCIADLSALPKNPVTFTYSSAPVVKAVAGANDCTPNSLNLSLVAPEAGVTYYLEEAIAGRVAGSDRSGVPYSWSPSTAGSYTVYAVNPCDATTPILMSGGPFVLTQAPTAFGVSIVEAGPYCAQKSYTVLLANTETGVTYTLRNPLSNIIATISGNGSARAFAPTVLGTSGNYSVTASKGGCTSNMSNTLSVGALPSVYNIIGGSVCQGSNLSVELAASAAGVDYTLAYDDGTLLLYGQTITPPTNNFSSVTGVGTYYVVAQAANGCRANMNGIASINARPTILPLNVQGNVCPGGQVSIGTGASPAQGPATTYVLMRNGTDLFSLSGNNGVVNFGDQTVAGTYTVRAVRGSCSQDMDGSLQVFVAPSVLIFSANKTKYCDSEPVSGVHLMVSNVDGTGIEYQLQQLVGGVWGNVGLPRVGIASSNITWLNRTVGVYRVLASNVGGCSIEMNKTISVELTPLPTASIAAQLPIRRCANIAGTFTLNVTLAGNAPFNFNIVDDKGATTVSVTNFNLSTYTLNVNPGDAQTTYSVVNLTDAASCSAVTGTNSTTVYVDPVPTITFSPAAPEVCVGSPISISANGALGGTYFWSDGLGFNQNINISPSATGPYTVTATTPQGCFASAPITVVVNPLPVLTFDTPGSRYEFCENNGQVNLTGNQAGATFSGRGVAIGGGIFDPNPASLDANIPFKAAIGANPITYQYTDTKGCFNRITKDIIVNSVPVVSISGLATTYCADAGVASFNGFPDGSTAGSTGTFTIVGYESLVGTWWDQGTPTGRGTINVGAAIGALGSPKTLTVRYTYQDPKTCTAVIERQVTLLPDLNTNLSIHGLPANLCETAAPVTLTPYLNGVSLLPIPVGGAVTFTGPGASITNNANGTATFSPTLAGAGNHTITMEYTDAAGCSGDATGTIQIGTPLGIPGLVTEYCSSDPGPYVLLGSIDGAAPVASDGTTFNVTAPDGTTVVVPNAPNGTYNFIPSALFGTPGYGAGTYQVIYRYEDTSSGCINTLTTEVEIIEELNSDFTIGGDPYLTAQSSYCIGDSPASLMGHVDLKTPANGGKALGSVFTSFTGHGVSGNGISGGFFNPSHSSVDHANPNTITHTVIHTVNGKSCPSPLKTFNVSVPLVDVGISNLSANKKYCTNGGTSVINVNGTNALDGDADFFATKGGSPTPFLVDNGDNTATINPSIGAGVYEITMVFTQTPVKGGCAKTVVETVEVLADNPVTFSGVTNNQKICLSSSPITLRGDMPSGGVGNFSISPIVAVGISNTGTDDLGNAVLADDGVAILTPGDLPIGLYTLRYEYTNIAGCSTYAEKKVEIVGSPATTYSVTGGGAYCIDDAPKGKIIGLSGSNSGVTYELLFGGASFTIPVTFTGTGSAFNFTVNNDGTGGDQLFATEGVYSVKAKLGGCDAIMTGSVTVKQYELVLQEVSKKDVSCVGANDGEVNLKTTGGSGAYQYSINGGANWQASPKFTGLAPIPHTFSVKDLSSAACEKISGLTVSISQPSTITIIENAALRKNVGCIPCTAGVDCEGSATITVTGGSPDYTTYPGVGYGISWSTGGAGFTETKMPAGTHSVTVTDGNGCFQSINIDIDVNPTLILTEDANPALHVNNVCNGGNTGSYVVTATGGSGTYQFALTDPATPPTTWLANNYGAGNQYRLINLDANTYTIWVRDCNVNYRRCYTQVNVPIVITEPAALTLVEESQTGITCNSATNGSFVVRASGGSSGTYQFTQTNPALGGAVWVNANNSTDGFTVSGKGTGVYTVWMRDLANPTCTYTSVSVTLSNVLALSYLVDEHTNVKCKSNTAGRLEVTAQGGSGSYVYQWENSLGAVISTDKFAENLAAGDYDLTITDLPNNCGPITHTFTITEPVLPLGINIISIKDNDCNATSNGKITVDVVGGTAPYNITWSNGVLNTEILSGLTPGNYSLSITDFNGCTFNNAATPIVVGELADISLTPAPVILTHNKCFGNSVGSIEVQVTGGSGNYQFRLQGAEIRNWVSPVPANADIYKFNNLRAGTYEVLVRDAANASCEYSLGSYTITQPGQLTLVSDPVTGKGNVTCYGGNDGFITVTASGGSGAYDYSKDNGTSWLNASQSNTHTFSNLTAGTYLIKVKDFTTGSCVSTATLVIDVNQPNQVKATVVGTTNASCFSGLDGTVTLSAQGGSGNYDYYCVQTATWQNSNVFTLPRGVYTFQTQDKVVAGCISTITAPVTVGSPLDYSTAVPVVKNITCHGAADGRITFNTTFSNGSAGLFEYSIDNGLTYNISPLTGLAAGTYTVMVRDGNNTSCGKTLPATVTITEPAPLNYVLNYVTGVQCNGGNNGEIKITVSGGTPNYSYQWSGISDANGGKTNNPTGLIKGNYNVSITDNNGCAILPLPLVLVTEPAVIVATYTPTHIAIGGQSTGSIVIDNITGGPTTNYAVVWDDGSTNMSRTNLAEGNYSFTVHSRDMITNAILCSRTYPVTLIDQSAPLDFTLTATDALCYGNNGSVEISVTSGNPSYQMSWRKTGVLIGSFNTNNINHNVSLPYGVYEVNIIDNVGGNVTKSIAVGQPDGFAINAFVDNDKICFGDLARISVNITGDAWDNVVGTKGDAFTVSWIDPDGLLMANGLYSAEATQDNLTKSGKYIVNIYHNLNSTCVKSEEITVSNPLPLGINQTVKDVTCFSGSDGQISVVATGRPAGHGFSYAWEVNEGSGWTALGGETAATIKDKPAALYRVTVQSISTICSYTSPAIEIKEPDKLQAHVTQNDIITCYGNDSGDIQLTNIRGGSEPYRYVLNGVETLLPVGTVNYTIPNLVSGNYSLSLVDVKGCLSDVYTVNIDEPEELKLTVNTATINCETPNTGLITLTLEGGRIISGKQRYLLIASPDGKADIVLPIVINTTGTAMTVNSPMLQNLPDNRYVIQVKDVNSNAVNKCVVSETVILEHINATADITSATCFGVNNGSIQNVQITGASSNITFTWSSTDGGTGFNSANLNQTGLSNGTYTLTIVDHDRGNCAVSFDFVVDYKNTIAINGTVSDVICNGQSSGAIITNPVGIGMGTNFNWSGPVGFTFADNTLANQPNLSTGSYSLTLTTTLDGEQCVASQNFTVIEPAAINYNAYFVNTDCDPYQRRLKVDFVNGGTGAYSYSWNGPAFIPVVPVDPKDVLIEKGGTYTITVKDKNLCAVSKDVFVPKVQSISSAISHIKCYNGNSGVIDITDILGGSGAYSFAWTGGPAGLFTSTQRNIDNLRAGTYYLRITDSNENVLGVYCYRDYTFVVTQPQAIAISPTVVDVSCYGLSDGQIEIGILGGTAPHTYNWSPVVGSNTAIAKNQYNLPADNYTVTVTDKNNCIASLTIPVVQDSEIKLSATVVDTQCDGTSGQIDLTVVGGSGAVADYKYNWSSLLGTGLNTAAQDQSNLTGGVYTVVFTDTNNGRSCSEQLSVVLSHPIKITNKIITPVNCSGNDNGAISFDVTGGDGNYTYVWSVVAGEAGNPLRLNINGKNQSGLSEGKYQVVITDGRIDPSLTNCSITEIFEVKASTGLTVSVAKFQSNMCYGEPTGRLEANVTGGSGNYQYKWDGIVGTSIKGNLTQGVYQLEVTDLTLLCKFIQSYQIKGPDAPITIDNLTVTPVLCFGEATGAISVVASGGTLAVPGTYTYQWSGPSSATGSNPTNLRFGLYDLKIIDDEGCEKDSFAIEIKQPATHVKLSNPVITHVSTVGGNNGSISVTVSGGVAPYSYQWFNSANTPIGVNDRVQPNLSADTYRVKVTDANLCEYELTGLTVVQPGSPLGFNRKVYNVSPCTGNANGEIHITSVYGGFPISGTNYRIQISGPGINVDENNTSWHLTNLIPGDYTIVITDNALVQVTETINIKEPSPLNIVTAKVADVGCFEAKTGQIDITVSGGMPDASGNYRVLLESPEKGLVASKLDAKAGVLFSFNNLPAGNYTVTAFDYANDFDDRISIPCSISDFKLITQPAALVSLSSVSGDTEICKGESYALAVNTSNWNFTTQGILRVSVYDGFATTERDVNKTPFQIMVTPSSTRTYQIMRVNKADGSLCLQGKTDGSKVTVKVNTLPTASISGPSEVCEDGTVNLSVNLTGVKPFDITWQDVLNSTSDTETVDAYKYTFTDTPVNDARYSILTVIDKNGCSNVGSGEVEVTVNDKPQVTLTGSKDICAGGNATLKIGLVKGVKPFTITYKANTSPGTMVVSPIGSVYDWVVSPTVTTTYEIISVVDGKGCQMELPSPVKATIVVNQLPKNIAGILSTKDLVGVCQGTTNIDYSVVPVDYATGYKWTVESGMNIITGDGTTVIRVDVDSTFTGGYVRVYAENSCGNSPVVEKWVNANPLPSNITVAPSGPTNICEGETGLIYTIPVSANASKYEWDIPTGLIVVGDASGTSIQVDIDPNVPFTIGQIRVRPVNGCGTNKRWSPSLTLTITPLPVVNAGLDERICRTTYILAGSPLKAGETGQWTIVKGSAQFKNVGVDKTRANAEVINLSQGVNTFIWTVTNNKGCTSFDEVIIYNDQVTVFAVADQYTVCDGTVNLTGTPLTSVVAPGGSAVWSTPNGAILLPANAASTKATNLARGENIFIWTIQKGACPSSATVKVMNNQPTEAVIFNASDVIISIQDLPCGDDFTSLKASVPVTGEETGYWRVESGSVQIDNFNSPDIQLTKIPSGDHILSWNILNGSCVSTTTVKIRNNSFKVNAGKDDFTCDGSILLSGTDTLGGAVGEWTVIEGYGEFVNADASTTTVHNLAQANNGRNVFRLTMRRNGCDSFDDVVISNNKPSKAEIQGGSSSITVCDSVYSLNAVDPKYGDGIWSVVSGKGIFEAPTVHNTTVRGFINGDNIYRWTVYNLTCSSSVEFKVTNLHVNAYAGADTAVCGTSAQLHATPAPSGAVGNWSVVPGMGSGGFRPTAGYPKGSENPNATVESLSSLTNELVWTVNNKGCTSTDTVVVSNNAPTPVDAPSGSTKTDFINLEAKEPEVGDGVWTLLEGRGTILNPTSHLTRIENLFPNINRFRWTVTYLNCSDFVDVEVISGTLANAHAGKDQLELCEDFTTLEANSPLNTYGYWTVVEGGVDFGSPDNQINPKAKIHNILPGRNVLKWTISYGGATSNSDDVIIINNKPSAAQAGYDITECGDSTKLNARVPLTGKPLWTILSGGGIFSDDTIAKPIVTKLAPGKNIFKYQITNKMCVSYDTLSVFNLEASEAIAGDNQTVCADSAEIRPTIPKYGNGTWRVIKGAGKGKDSKGNYTDRIEGNYVYELAPDENKLVWEVQVPGAAAGCIKRDTITITNNKPSLSFAGQNRPICIDEVTLSGSVPLNGSVGTWTLISGSGEIADSSLTNTLVSKLGKGKNRFRWTVDKNGCTSISEVEIANNFIEAKAGDFQINCADTAALQANNPSPGIGSWGIKGGSGSAKFSNNADPYTIVRNLDKGENILTWTIDHKGCPSVSEVKITNNAPSKADAGDNKSSCVNTFVLGASNPEVGNGVWTIRSGGGKFVNDSIGSTRVDSLKFGDNIFRWTVEHEGCYSNDDVQISFNTIEAKVAGNQDICSDKVFLEANSAVPGVGTWTVVGGGSQAKFVNSHDPLTEAFDLARGKNQLKWTINYKGCITSKEVMMTNHMPSTAYAGNTQEHCKEETILDATPVTIGTGKWEILTGSAILLDSEITKPKAKITGLSKGENVLRWTVTSDNGLCDSKDDVRIINNLPSIPYAGKNEEYCSPTVVLKAAPVDFGTGRWSIEEGGGDLNDPALPNATISNLKEGKNILRWTVSQGQCFLTSDIEVINNTPSTANAGPDIDDCKDYATLDANIPTQGNGKGSWTLTSGNAEFKDTLNPKTLVNNLTFGQNILRWNIQKGKCISSDEITVNNNVPDQAKAGTNRETCENYLTLNANDPTTGKGSWLVLSGNGKFDDPHSPISIVRDLKLGENKFKWVVSYGSCSTEDVVEIISNKAAPYAGEDDISYKPNYELKASNPGKLGAMWSLVAGEGSFEDETFYNTRVDGLKEGINTFRWLMDINGCVTFDDVSIDYRMVPDASFKVDTFQGCYPLEVHFTNQSVGGSTFSWDFGNDRYSSNRNPVHTFRQPGEYMVTLTAPGPDNVDGIYQMKILVHDHPTADFTYGPDVLYVPGDVLMAKSHSVDADKYLWDFGDGGTSTQVNPAYKYTEKGFYTLKLKVTSVDNCVDEMVKVNAVEVRAEGFIVFPNAFTPRPDGGTTSTVGGGETNTVFRPVYNDVVTYKLQIFNRWGQLIYEGQDIEEGWNGFFNGQLSPQAVYVYKAMGTFVSGREFNESGSVLLVR